MLLKQSTARNRMVLLIDATDHITGAPGKTLTITASKDGGAFGSITPTVTDRGNGWYNLALTASHTDTLGDLALHITATGADPLDPLDQVVVDVPGGSVASVTGAVGSVTTVNDKTGYRLSATGVDDILDEAITEPAGVFSWGSATLRNILGWLGARSSNKTTQTATTQTLRNRADSASVASASVADDGTTSTRGSFS